MIIVKREETPENRAFVPRGVRFTITNDEIENSTFNLRSKWFKHGHYVAAPYVPNGVETDLQRFLEEAWAKYQHLGWKEFSKRLAVVFNPSTGPKDADATYYLVRTKSKNYRFYEAYAYTKNWNYHPMVIKPRYARK